MTSRTEDEDLAQIKDWWQRNGKPLVTGGILALAVVFGWQAWQKYQTNQAQGASIVYQQPVSYTHLDVYKRQMLHKGGFNVTVRTTRGDDIDAACGQLVGQVMDRTRRSERYIAVRQLAESESAANRN